MWGIFQFFLSEYEARTEMCCDGSLLTKQMIDFPQFGSSRNFIKPGHWVRVNQRQDDDDHVSRVVPLLDLITRSPGQKE